MTSCTQHTAAVDIHDILVSLLSLPVYVLMMMQNDSIGLEETFQKPLEIRAIGFCGAGKEKQH
jgi:hypothetical protein